MSAVVVDINYVAVIVAAAAHMAIGMAWYSQSLFGKMWMQESGRSMADIEASKKEGMGKMMAIAGLGALVMSYVLAHFVDIAGVTDVVGAWWLAFWLWLGFVATVQLNSVLWEGKSWKYFLINISYHLVSLFVAALILAYWV